MARVHQSLSSFREPPIRTFATVLEGQSGDRVFKVRLPNGKISHGHVPWALFGRLAVEAGIEVLVEFTPFDLDRGRIVETRDQSGIPNS